jgi:hypothetical protein
MQAVNERELIERCRSGDERAFQELVDGFKDLVFALIARTVQDRSRAEDLAQNVFLRIASCAIVWRKPSSACPRTTVCSSPRTTSTACDTKSSPKRCSFRWAP